MAGGVLLSGGIGGDGINPNLVRIVLVVMALGLAGYIVGPSLYWHVAEALGSSSACPPCAACDCSAQPLLSLPEELINVSSTGDHYGYVAAIQHIITSSQFFTSPGNSLLQKKNCAKNDPEVSEEMDKNFIDLLAEELKLKEEHATEAQHRADVTLLEAKKLASQYQKEADKCSAGMDTCEEARERAEAALLQQKKVTALWEQRARQRGWRNARSY